MPPNPTTIVLVTPVWNDSRRLGIFGPQLAASLATWNLDIAWVISDDGSKAEDLVQLQSLCAQLRLIYPKTSLFQLPQHQGKGAAVVEAWRQNLATQIYAFIDADGAINTQNLHAILLNALSQKNTAVIGVRKFGGDKKIKMTLIRRLTHYVFMRLAQMLTGLSVSDPQCGVKCIPAGFFNTTNHALKENGMAFDCELLLSLQQQGISIEEIPIDWFDKPNGSFNALNSFLPMLCTLWKLRR